MYFMPKTSVDDDLAGVSALMQNLLGDEAFAVRSLKGTKKSARGTQPKKYKQAKKARRKK